MILSTFSTLAGFVAAIRLAVCFALAMAATSRWNRTNAPNHDSDLSRFYLHFLLAGLVVMLNAASWPLLYLMLQSHVPAWSGVMCIYGVTQIGRGASGSAGYLPVLMQAIQVGKPLLVFVSGAWFSLYMVNRAARTGPLTRLLTRILPIVALLGALDAGAELAWIVIPKAQASPASGCCTAEERDDFAGYRDRRVEPRDQRMIALAFYLLHAGLLAGIHLASRPGRPDRPGMLALAALACGGWAAFAACWLFMTRVAAPRILQLPFHQCAYDLYSFAPETAPAAILYAAGCMLLGWAVVSRGLGDSPETHDFLMPHVRNLLRLSLFALLSSLSMVTVELVVS